EVMAFVDDDQPPSAQRQPPATDLLVRPDDQGDAQTLSRRFPLEPQRRRHQACRGMPPVECRGHGERDVCLAAPYWIGKDRPSIPPQRRQCTTKAWLLLRQQP